MPARRRRVGVPRELRVEMGVDVDEARASRARRRRRSRVRPRPVDRRRPSTMRSPSIATSAGEAARARAVDDRAAADHEVMGHGRRRERRAEHEHVAWYACRANPTRPFPRAPTRSAPASPSTTISPTRGSRRRSSSRSGCAGRCCSRARQASARPRSRKVLAAWTGGELVRLQCYEGIDVDPGRLRVGLRRGSSCTCGRSRRAAPRSTRTSSTRERFLVKRPLLRALDHGAGIPPVLLIDEVDRADDEFEAFLLEILSDWTISVPELGAVHAEVPPVVVLTSNRTRDVHDALKRRCLYHWIAHPDFDRELAIVRLRAPEVGRPAGARRRGRGRGDARARAVQAARCRRDDRLGAVARDARAPPVSTSGRSTRRSGRS